MLQLQPHVCVGKMTCLKLLVVAPPWPGSSELGPFGLTPVERVLFDLTWLRVLN